MRGASTSQIALSCPSELDRRPGHACPLDQLLRRIGARHRSRHPSQRGRPPVHRPENRRPRTARPCQLLESIASGDLTTPARPALDSCATVVSDTCAATAATSAPAASATSNDTAIRPARVAEPGFGDMNAGQRSTGYATVETRDASGTPVIKAVQAQWNRGTRQNLDLRAKRQRSEVMPLSEFWLLNNAHLTKKRKSPFTQSICARYGSYCRATCVIA